MIELVGKLNPQIVAGAVNNNQAFLTSIMGKLDPHATANVINNNAGWVSNLVSLLNPSVIATVVNNSSSATTELLKYLNPKVVADVLNANEAFLEGLINNLDPTVLAQVVNSPEGGQLVVGLLGNGVSSGGIDPAVLAQVLNETPGFTSALLDPTTGLDASKLAEVLNSNTEPFISDLIGHLDVSVITGAMAATTLKSYDPGGPKGMLYDLVKPVAQGGISPQVVAALLNNNPTFLSNVMGDTINAMNPDDPSGTLATLLSDPNLRTFLNQVIDNLSANPAVMKNVADAMAAPGALSFMHNLMLALGDNAAVQFLVDRLGSGPGGLGIKNSLQYVTMKAWSDIGLLGSPYLFATITDFAVAPYP
jgi:hypothetical protein